MYCAIGPGRPGEPEALYVPRTIRVPGRAGVSGGRAWYALRSDASAITSMAGGTSVARNPLTECACISLRQEVPSQTRSA